MKRRIKWTRGLNWKNPLADLDHVPYLGSPIFPVESMTPEADRAHTLLRRYFTPHRKIQEADKRNLKRYLSKPQKNTFVLWGEIGIGKTWFVRYYLDAITKALPGKFRYGVVDMLRATPANAHTSLVRQLGPTLEDYLVNVFGSLENGVRPLAILRAKKRFGSRLGESDKAFNIQVAANVEEILAADDAKRVDLLLEAIEVAEGPLLFLAIDNLDRSVGAEQAGLAQVVVRMLRNGRIRLILPLRPSSRQVLDQFQALGFLEKQEMSLSEVDEAQMLRRRFEVCECEHDLGATQYGIRLADTHERVTFPDLLDRFLSSDAGPFVLSLCAGNARRVLDYVDRILYSNQLSAVENFADAESCTAALLMLSSSKFDQRYTGLINLFDNEEPRESGNSLIRFRVLEYLKSHGEVGSAQARLWDHFDALGYKREQVREVLALFVGAGLITASKGDTPDDVRNRTPEDLGKLKTIVPHVDAYFTSLLESPWYFICAKRGIHIHDWLISKDEDDCEYLTDGAFTGFLKEEEDLERTRIKDWERRQGKRFKNKLTQPHALAKVALAKRGRKPTAAKTVQSEQNDQER